MRSRCWFLGLVVVGTVHAADIGGWMQAAYYASGMCYLVSDKVARDSVAAGAWLTRAVELEHPLARRALNALRESNAAPPLHPNGYHCHELGQGRRLCHGGPVLQ
jgi:TPR repeat protein